MAMYFSFPHQRTWVSSILHSGLWYLVFGSVSIRSWPRINSLLVCLFFWISLSVAVIALRQLGHFMTTGYNHLVKYVAGCYHDPKVWIKTPFVMSFVQCTSRWKGFETSGSPGSEPTLRVVIKVSNVFCFVSVCVIVSMSHFVLMYFHKILYPDAEIFTYT